MFNVQESIQLAVKHYRANYLTQAELVYRQILATEPQQPDALHGLGVVAQRKGNYQVAEQFLTAAIQAKPNYLSAWVNLGNLFQVQDQLNEAVECYQQVLAMQPNLVAVHNNLGYTLQQQGLLSEAIACYQKALEIQPSCTEAEVNLANTLFIQGELSPEKQKHYALVNYKLGLARQQAEDLENAITYYQQAISLNQNLTVAQEKLEAALQKQNIPSINSFDIFDTLIARFCINPQQIFLEVENITGFNNFASYRQQAEGYLLKNAQDYNLDDIYQRLAIQLSLQPEELAKLKQAEIAVEINNVIGIKENLATIKDGDVLVSDMYLPETVIWQMLHQGGLDKQVSLFLRAKGKGNGTVWQEIKEQNINIAQHTGDNFHSDIVMAERAGIQTNFYPSSQPSPVEKELNKIGAKRLAKLIRKFRLGNYFQPALKNEFYNCFIQTNLIILVTFSLFLSKKAQQHNIQQYLFSSRDCYYLQKIFRQVANQSQFPIDSEYFFTSRLARIKCSEDYRSYVLNLVEKQPNSAVVDLVGTGMSLAYLFKQIDEDFKLPIALFHQINLKRVKSVYQGINLDHQLLALIPNQVKNLNIDALELLNSIEQQMITDVSKQGKNNYSPIFGSEPIPEPIALIIDSGEQIIDDFCHHLDQETVTELIHNVDFTKLTHLSVILYQKLGRNQHLSSLMRVHIQDNQKVEHELSAMLQ